MTELLMPRRKFLSGLFGLVAAPAVVKAANIMPVRSFVDLPPPPVGFRRLTPDDYYMLGILNEKKFAQWENVFASRGL